MIPHRVPLSSLVDVGGAFCPRCVTLCILVLFHVLMTFNFKRLNSQPY